MTTLARSMIAIALAAASLLAADPAPAHACGGYGISVEDQVLGAAVAAVADEPAARIEAVRRDDDGTFEVEVSWPTYVPGQVIAQYLYFGVDDRGQWAETGHSYKFTKYRDVSADARKPTPRMARGARKAAQVARR